MPATAPLPRDLQECTRSPRASAIRSCSKASWGGGGRGMRVLESDAQLREQLPAARREAQAAFGNDEVYLEKLVRRARHVEVQILGDHHGNLVHLFERDCTVQRRNQKVVERAPAVFLSDAQRQALCEAGLAIGRAARLRQRRHGGVPAGCRHRAVLLHRGESAHPGGAHGHRVRDRHRSGEGADPHRGRRTHRHPRERRARRRPTSASTPTRSSAASPPRTPRTTSSPTTARSRPTAAPQASECGWMPARPTPAPSSRAPTTRCW